MKNTTKIALGALAGLAIGISIGVALSNDNIMEMLKDRIDDAKSILGESMNDVLEERKGLIEDIKEKFESMNPMPGPLA